MGAVLSYADVIKDWEALLTALRENAPNLPNLEASRLAFEEHVAKTKEMKARQDSQTAARQEATQELATLLKEGGEMAIKLRALVKGTLGPKRERLVQFGIAPQRKRRRKAAAQPPAPETPTPAQPGTTPPPAAKPEPVTPPPPATKPAA